MISSGGFLAASSYWREGSREVGKWGNGEMGKWGSGEVGKWGSGEVRSGKNK